MRLVLVALGFWLLAGCKTAAKQGPTFTVFPAPAGARESVKFSPPVGKILVEHSLTERTDVQLLAGQKTTTTATIELTMNSGWAKEGENYVLTQRVESLKGAQNGKPIEDPLAHLVTKFPLEIAFAPDGTFLRLTNPEDATKAVSEVFTDPEQAAEVQGFFTGAAIEDQARIEWEQKYGDLFGAPLSADKPSYTVDGTAVGQTPVLYVLERNFVGTAKTEYGDAVVLELKCVQSAEAAKDKAAYEALLEARGKPQLDPSTSCSGRQVIAKDPFVPVSLTLVVKSAPKDGQGNVLGELTLSRATNAEALK